MILIVVPIQIYDLIYFIQQKKNAHAKCENYPKFGTNALFPPNKQTFGHFDRITLVLLQSTYEKINFTSDRESSRTMNCRVQVMAFLVLTQN